MNRYEYDKLKDYASQIRAHLRVIQSRYDKTGEITDIVKQINEKIGYMEIIVFGEVRDGNDDFTD